MFKTDKYEENENNIFFLTPKIEIKMNLKEIIFFNRHKKAKELASSKNFKSIVDFDNVTEAFIYEYLLINKKNLDFTKLENKTLISGLTKKNFESLKINVDYYFDYKNVFFKFIDLLNNDLIAATTFDKNNLLDLYVNDEMLLNQPLSFMNNSNLMYYSMLNYLIPSPNISLIEKYDYLLQKQSTVRILLKNIYNIESLSEDEVWTVVFYIISIGDSHVVSDFKEKLIKKKKKYHLV